jgi:hypothetical protein
MTEEHVDSLIPYDDVVQEALRAVVGRVLGDVARDGLPGDHHFYITFKTQAPGVAIPQHLHERFPDEMTIVLQTVGHCQSEAAVCPSDEYRAQLSSPVIGAVSGMIRLWTIAL